MTRTEIPTALTADLTAATLACVDIQNGDIPMHGDYLSAQALGLVTCTRRRGYALTRRGAAHIRR
jgi:hypothetical protein